LALFIAFCKLFNNNILCTFFINKVSDPLKFFQQSGRFYFHADGLRSVIALSDRGGRTVEVYRYDVFGRTVVYDGDGRRLRVASAVGNPYFFTGRRLDFETGLYYYRARMYSPNLGRFLQTDPIGYADGMNIYAYCGNNPLVWLDPYGTFAWQTWARRAGYFVAGAAVGAVVTAAVIVAAPAIAAAGATALVAAGVSAATAATVSTGVVTTGLFVGGVAGGIMTGINTYDNVKAGNWDAVAFDAGAVAGSLAVGVSGGGRALAEGLMGKSSPAPNTWNPLKIAGHELRNVYNPAMGLPGLAWMATAPTPASGGAAAMGIAGWAASSFDVSSNAEGHRYK
jgi:RHS repeat-associated protein